MGRGFADRTNRLDTASGLAPFALNSLGLSIARIFCPGERSADVLLVPVRRVGMMRPARTMLLGHANNPLIYYSVGAG